MGGNRPWALVTGASTGLGRALALRLADEGYGLLLASRDASGLSEVARAAAARGAAAELFPCDLSAPGAGGELARRLGGREVEVLINNAGFAVHGPFAETPLERELALLRLQLDAALELTKAVLPGMRARGRGRILNVGSLYSFAPVPEQAVYGACKAFLLSWSDALAVELEGSGVTVTALCPGVVRTEFRRRAGLREGRGPGRDAASVADAAVRGLLAGRRVVVPGPLNRAFSLLAGAIGGRRAARLVAAVNRWRGLKD